MCIVRHIPHPKNTCILCMHNIIRRRLHTSHELLADELLDRQSRDVVNGQAEEIKKEIEAIKKEIEEIKKQIEAIKKEIEEIKKQIEEIKKEID